MPYSKDPPSIGILWQKYKSLIFFGFLDYSRIQRWGVKCASSRALGRLCQITMAFATHITLLTKPRSGLGVHRLVQVLCHESPSHTFKISAWNPAAVSPRFRTYVRRPSARDEDPPATKVAQGAVRRIFTDAARGLGTVQRGGAFSGAHGAGVQAAGARGGVKEQRGAMGRGEGAARGHGEG